MPDFVQTEIKQIDDQLRLLKDEASRLEAARAALAEVSERVQVPAENLVSPDLVRRLCWDWEGGGEQAVDAFLRAGQARPWQRRLVVEALARALQPPADAEGSAQDSE